MGKKYRKYKNAIEKYLSSERGKRFFQIAYSFGASIVIIGTLFKIIHAHYGTEIMAVGLIAEAIIFALSAFDRPPKEYKWEEVYPVLGKDEEEDDENPEEEIEVPSVAGGSIGGTVIIGGVSGVTQAAAAAGETAADSKDSKGRAVLGGRGAFIAGGGVPVVSGAADVSASEKYSEQLTRLSESMEKFAEVTASLTNVSNTLLDSFKSITDNSDGIGKNTRGYISQMEALNRNITGLNTIYEIQLKGVSGQINTIEQINAGLDRIKKLYDGSLADSSVFKTETEKMAVQLAELNRVYARMLQAMTVNMNMNLGGFGTAGTHEQK
ncbi:MAG: gliding motility protein GldL [Prevotella sp.]|jgi:gliding motility-associated protein GldL|nr:gliding motility protein GldL [Prevotella sp.]